MVCRACLVGSFAARCRERSAANGHLEIATALVDMLMAAGAAIDRKTNLGEPALFMAAANGHADVVKALLAAGANANDTRGDGSSALRLASERRHIATVQVLLAAGATGN